MRIVHSAYGLRLSASQVIPGLELAPHGEHVDIEIHLQEWPGDQVLLREGPWMRPGVQFGDETVHGIWRSRTGSLFRFAFRDGTGFLFDSGGERIWAKWPPAVSLEDVSTYLLGPVLGYMLRLRGTLALHASAVSCEGAAFALAGNAGAGKSTTASALAIRGCTVISDDVTPLVQAREAGFAAVPGPPRLCLWPASTVALFGHEDALPPITQGWEKRSLSRSTGSVSFEEQPVPLHAIYVLGDRSPSPEAPCITPLPPAAGLLALVANTYGNLRLEPEHRSGEFSALDQLVRAVPIRRVTPAREIDRVEALCDLLLADFRAIRPATT